MHKYKKILIIVAIIIQCIALGAICYQRESVLVTGETVFIKTRPVDPRDLFRGDYVRLNYGISRVPLDLVKKDEIKEIRKRERRVYLSYETDSRNLMQPLKLSLEKPPEDRYIRGYTERSWGDHINVRYSIEKYFMQQGKGLMLERGKRLEGVRIPLEMKVAVGSDNGIAVLSGFRYSEVGMGIILPRRNNRETPISFQIKIKLVNASEQPIYIMDTSNHRSFIIELSHNQSYPKEKKVKFKYPREYVGLYDETEVVQISPKSLYEFTIDLAEPEYQLIRGEKEVPWSDMKYWETARIVYQTPGSSQLQNIKDPDILWQGRVISRSFSGHNFRD